MAAPTPVGSCYSAAFGTSSAWGLLITNGFTAGNTILLAVTQYGSVGTVRSITSVTDGAGNTYNVVVQSHGVDSLTNFIDIVAAVQITSAVSAGATLTVNLNGNTSGDVFAQEFTPCTNPSVSDTKTETTTTTSHNCSTSGINTSGDVVVFAAGVGNGTLGTTTAGGTFTKLAATTRSHAQYLSSAGGLSANTGPWTSVNSRSSRNAMAAFYAVAAGTKAKPLLSRSTRFFTRSF